MQKCHQTSKLQHLRQGVVEGWLELFSVSQTGLDSCERTVFFGRLNGTPPMFPVIKQPIDEVLSIFSRQFCLLVHPSKWGKKSTVISTVRGWSRFFSGVIYNIYIYTHIPLRIPGVFHHQVAKQPYIKSHQIPRISMTEIPISAQVQPSSRSLTCLCSS